MLRLTDIRKAYGAGDHIVHALRGVSLQFRKSEFVSILGPSGCGKTTLLNIIGGLDRYTTGDLVIDGKSTGNFRDRDWDAYRNHTVGFVFQRYYLIPHQSVLQNVELALALSGVPGKERHNRAKAALEQVGLGDQMHKKPAQMSGGQMQRVAIARALVNNPDILLADEPTGALDTATSEQVMEILKAVSKERLVIMVTHNPELAARYATRTIKMLDGRITHDSNPLTEAEEEKERSAGTEKKRKQKLPRMSFATSFGLSMKNLFTKMGRTVLTCFAGSIGIVGIALIFAISQGTNGYIQAVQEDTLTAYPLTLEASTVDLDMLIGTFIGKDHGQVYPHGRDQVYSRQQLYDMIRALNHMEATENDLRSFHAYLGQKMEEAQNEKLRGAINGIQYTYDLNLLVYTKSVDGDVIVSDPQKLLTEAIMENLGTDVTGMLQMKQTVASSVGAYMPGGQINLWNQMLSGMEGQMINPVLKNQYDVLAGGWPERYDEIVLAVNENNELDDLTLYALGLMPKQEVDAVFDSVSRQEPIDAPRRKWRYEDLMNMQFRVVLNSDCYVMDEASGVYADLRHSDAGLRYLYDNGIVLKVSGIIRPKDNATAPMLRGAIGYTQALTEFVISRGEGSAAVQAQLETPDRDIFSGLPFQNMSDSMGLQEKAQAFRERVAMMQQEEMAESYRKIRSTPTHQRLAEMTDQALEGVNGEQMRQALLSAMENQMRMSRAELSGYVQNMSDEELVELYRQMVQQQIKARVAAEAQPQLASFHTEQLADMLKKELPGYTEAACAQYYDEVLKFSEATLQENLIKLGRVELDNPRGIYLYPTSFQSKNVIEQMIGVYNASVEELKQIHYTDYVGLIMASVTTILDAITYVLVAFVSISLLVSSIMIGVITLISVQERTQEIGILRAMGASKGDVCGMFNAETVMIGFASGVLGVALTWLLCIPVNVFIRRMTGLGALEAYLPWPVALILIAISVGLTLISGIIPSRSAAKKNPVSALRSE